jgi:hypothetical protein
MMITPQVPMATTLVASADTVDYNLPPYLHIARVDRLAMMSDKTHDVFLKLRGLHKMATPSRDKDRSILLRPAVVQISPDLRLVGRNTDDEEKSAFANLLLYCSWPGGLESNIPTGTDAITAWDEMSLPDACADEDACKLFPSGDRHLQLHRQLQERLADTGSLFAKLL